MNRCSCLEKKELIKRMAVGWGVRTIRRFEWMRETYCGNTRFIDTRRVHSIWPAQRNEFQLITAWHKHTHSAFDVDSGQRTQPIILNFRGATNQRLSFSAVLRVRMFFAVYLRLSIEFTRFNRQQRFLPTDYTRFMAQEKWCAMFDCGVVTTINIMHRISAASILH